MKGSPFTPAQSAIVLKLYANTSTATIAKKCGRSVASIYRYAFVHGIKKSQAYLATEASGRHNVLAASGVAYRYTKGHSPANKGRKQTDYMSPQAIQRTASTRFAKGALPHNTNKQGNGAIVLRQDKCGNKYKYIRLALRQWVPLHQHLWWQANGKYNTRTHCLWFINRNSLDVSLDNLELITRGENVQRNKHKHRLLPPEFKTTKHLIKQLKTKIYASNNI
jgi:hypothetical protein